MKFKFKAQKADGEIYEGEKGLKKRKKGKSQSFCYIIDYFLIELAFSTYKKL
jgi:hypothetical protein